MCFRFISKHAPGASAAADPVTMASGRRSKGGHGGDAYAHPASDEHMRLGLAGAVPGLVGLSDAQVVGAFILLCAY